jgi:hypothetical protein
MIKLYSTHRKQPEMQAADRWKKSPDVVDTAILDMDTIGQLAAVGMIRTFLNFFRK